MNTQTDDFTILGGAGFVGSLLVSHLRSSGKNCRVPAKGDPEALAGSLGHVVYCAGTTSDFRSRPFDTIDAHVSLINQILQQCEFTSLTYLSSTRVYIYTDSTSETSPIIVDPNISEDLFNLSKLTGEAICRHSGRQNVRSIRLSNVVGRNFGSNDFLFSVIQAAVRDGSVLLHTSYESEKDYIHCDDAVELIAKIAMHGTMPLYNVAAGRNRTNREVLDEVRKATAASISVTADSRTIRFAPIDIGRIRSEFHFEPRPLLPLIHQLAAEVAAARKT